MVDSSLHATKVDLSGLMTVLSSHLYSTPMVAVRELVQNAHDACTRRRLEDPDGAVREPAAIHIVVNASTRTLSVVDTGAGLTEQEVIDYLATVGTGATRHLRQQSHDDALIGMFGLGFLSAFVVADRVQVTTTSYQPSAVTLLYQSSNGTQFSLTETTAQPVGTRVDLKLKADFDELSDVEAVRAVLSHYCIMLAIPVTIEGDDEAVNHTPPPWRSEMEHPVRLRKERFAFAARIDDRFEPIAVLPIEKAAGSSDNDDDSSDARGLLWLQDGMSYSSSDNRAMRVYVRGMMLDDDARDLLPRWAGFVSGVIESSALTPTASRETLQKDARYDATRAHIAQSLVTGLARIAKEEPETWRRVLLRHNEGLLAASLVNDELFELLADSVTIPTSEGDLLVRTLMRRGDGKLYVSLSERGGFEEMLLRALQTPVATGTRFAVLPFVAKYVAARGGQVIRLGTDEGNQALFQPASLNDAERLRLATVLDSHDRELVPARFKPTTLPFVIVHDRDAEVKARIDSDEADKRISTAALGLARLFTAKTQHKKPTRMYVNVDAPVVMQLLARDVAADHPAAVLLRSLVVLMTGPAAGENAAALAGALADYSQVVSSLLAPLADGVSDGHVGMG